MGHCTFWASPAAAVPAPWPDPAKSSALFGTIVVAGTCHALSALTSCSSRAMQSARRSRCLVWLRWVCGWTAPGSHLAGCKRGARRSVISYIFRATWDRAACVRALRGGDCAMEAALPPGWPTRWLSLLGLRRAHAWHALRMAAPDLHFLLH